MAVPVNFSAKNTDDAIHAQWWIEIEGIRRRYGTTSPAWAPADTGILRPILPYFTRIPTISGPKAKPLNGTSSPHEFGVGILDVDDSLTALFSTHDTSGGRTWLAVDCTDADVQITVNDSGVFSLPCDVFVDAETMRATSAPDGVTLAVTREMYGSVAVEHLIEDSAGNERVAVVSTSPTYMHTRRCLLKESRAGLLEDDAITLRGAITGFREKGGVWTVEATGVLNLLTGMICQKMPKTTLKEKLVGSLGGSQDVPDLEPGVPRDVSPSTYWCMRCNDTLEDFPASGAVKINDELIGYDNKHDAHKLLDIGDHSDYMTANDYGHVVSHPLPNRALFSTTCFGGVDKGEYAKFHRRGSVVELVLTDAACSAGRDPISVVLQLLLSGGDGGTYDTLPDGTGLGLPESQVDISGMEDLRDKLGLRDFLFVIPDPVSAKEWIEKNILRMCLLFFVEKWDGTIGLSRLWTRNQAIAKGADLAITEGVMVDGLPTIETPKPPFGSFKVNFDWFVGDGEFHSSIDVVLGDSIEKFGALARNFEIELMTVFSFGRLNGESTIQSANMALVPLYIQDYIGTIWARHAVNPMPIVKCRVPYNRLTDVQVGNIVTLTSSTLPDLKNSDRGVSGVYLQVIGVKPNPSRCTVELTLWMIDVHDLAYREIAPAAKISAYTVDGGGAGIDRLALYSDIFTSADNKDSDAFQEVSSFYATLLNSEHEELTPGEYIKAGAGDDYIDLISPATAAPSDGDYVTIAPYDEAGSGAKARWAFGADANDVLGAGDDDAHRRE